MRRFLRFRAASAVSSTYSTEGGRTIGRFHIRGAAKRRGGILPARLRFSARRGMSLVELMVAMLVLFFVCVSWLTIFQIQSANRESYRREAVERLAGMMDVISQQGFNSQYASETSWSFCEGKPTRQTNSRIVNPVFEPTESSLGYRIRIKKSSAASDLISYNRNIAEDDSEAVVLTGNSPVLIGELFEQSGTLGQEEYSNREEANVGKRIWRVAVVLRAR